MPPLRLASFDAEGICRTHLSWVRDESGAYPTTGQTVAVSLLDLDESRLRTGHVYVLLADAATDALNLALLDIEEDNS
jgi:hypothetical protein